MNAGGDARSTRITGARLFDRAGDLDADTVLVRDGRIVAVGTARDVPVEGDTIDLGGALLLAGLTDTHTHLFEWARRGASIDLDGARDVETLLARLRSAAAVVPDDPEWIGGGGWDPRFFGRPDVFTRHTLDEIFGSRPVFFEARDFHTLWCNTAALRRAGAFDANVAVPEGGRIGRDADGQPDGLLYETAWDLVRRARPAVSDAVADRWLRAAESRLHAMGVTGVHGMEPADVLRHYRRRRERGEARLRICFHTPLDDLDARIERGEVSYVLGDPWLVLGGVKVFMDGSMGSRTAAMSAPYPDGSRGDLLMEPTALEEVLARAAAAGIAGSVHAIGDRTVDAVVSAFETVRARFGGGLRHRIEHAQCVRPETVTRIARAHVVCAMQPVHLIDDVTTVHDEWGANAAHAFPARALLDAGVPVVLGSDMPVATPDPRVGIHAAVTRRGRGGRVLAAEHAISVREALDGYTAAAARAIGAKDRCGRIRVGFPADLTAIDDVRAESADAWLEARVRLTMVDGEVVHDEL